jgi:hypothetical protein
MIYPGVRDAGACAGRSDLSVSQLCERLHRSPLAVGIIGSEEADRSDLCSDGSSQPANVGELAVRVHSVEIVVIFQEVGVHEDARRTGFDFAGRAD